MFLFSPLLSVRDAAELPAHLAARAVHDDRPPQPGQDIHSQPLHARRNVSAIHHASAIDPNL